MHSTRRPHDDLPFPARSPVRIFGLVLLLVFAVEGVIMLVLPRLPGTWRGTVLQSVIDASVLTIVMAPAVWFLTVMPLRRLFEARGGLLRRLLEAQEQERAHIARDLHDSVGQNLTALMVGLKTVEDAGDLDTASARARDLRAFAAEAHGEVRRLARGLRPFVLEDLGLVAALERLCDDFQRTHAVAVALACGPAPAQQLDAGAQTALYRIVQEALTNVARHAGATKVEVRLARTGASIALTIRDDGLGFDVPEADALLHSEDGFGMRSIRERALMLGGECVIQTRRGAGTAIMGDYIGAQMAGFNVESVLGLVDHVPDGDINQPYPARTLVIGGNTPYTTHVTMGALPLGLSIDSATGVLSGAPFVEGHYSFTITATDADAVQASKAYTMLVGPGSPGEVSGLLLAKHGNGGDLDLAWNFSCGVHATDYAVYAGTLGSWYSHSMQRCTTGGAAATTITASVANAYYLVVALSPAAEGSYGLRSDGAELPQAADACFAMQILAPCP